jgi:Fe-S-cluster containining protein
MRPAWGVIWSGMSDSHPGRDLDAQCLRELQALYAQLDALYADWSCPSTTECCSFGRAGRQPFVTSIEFLAMRQALARRGGLPSQRRRRLPQLSDADAHNERRCPLLTREQRCSIYADRPLGCRSFYCERARRGERPDTQQLSEIVQAVQDLAARHRMSGEQTRPLLIALEAG